MTKEVFERLLLEIANVIYSMGDIINFRSSHHISPSEQKMTITDIAKISSPNTELKRVKIAINTGK
jgi:hypothetical protein